jgi:hypothetical protein
MTVQTTTVCGNCSNLGTVSAAWRRPGRALGTNGPPGVASAEVVYEFDQVTGRGGVM